MVKKYLDSDGVTALWKAVKMNHEDIAFEYKSPSEGGDGNIKLVSKSEPKKVLAELPAAPFIKDGMLEDVTIVTSSKGEPVTYNDVTYTDGTKFIQFKWNVDGGKKTDYLKLDELGATYTAGDDKSIIIDDSNKISVNDVKTTKTTTFKKIPVAGGPLAELLTSKNVYKDGIPAGTKVEDILMSLFCKELWSESVVTKDATLVSTVALPTITMSTSTVEIGTPVHYSVINGKSGYNATPHKVTELEYGYSLNNDNVPDNKDAKTYEASFGEVTLASNTSTLTLSGIVDKTISEGGTEAGGSLNVEGDVIAKEGKNTLNAINTSATYTGTCHQLPVIYACSNLGKTDISHVSELKEEVTLTSQSVTSDPSSKTFYSKYKYFIGVYPTVYSKTEYNSDFIRNNADQSNWMNETVDITIPTEVGTKGMYIAIPEGVDDTGATLKVIQTTALNNDASKDIAKNVRTVNIKCGGSHTKNYKVFTWDFPGGTEDIEKFHITKF